MNIPVTSDNIILGQSPSLSPLSDSNGGGSGSGIGGAIGFIMAIVLIGYILYIIVNLHYKKADVIQNWGKNRCNMGIIPIAGWIKPIGKDKYVGLSGTMHNFEYCVDTMTNSLMKIILEPFLILINQFLDMCKDIFKAIGEIYDKFENMHFNIFGFLDKLFAMIKNIKNSLSYINDKIDSIKSKFILILENVVNMIDKLLHLTYDLFKLSINKTLDILKNIHKTMWIEFLSALASTSAAALTVVELTPLAWFPATWLLIAIAIGVGVIFTGIGISLNYGLNKYEDALNLFNLSTTDFKNFDEIEKNPPYCFTDKVKIRLGDSREVMIKDICPDDLLASDIIVTGHITIDINKEIQVYNYNGVEVTGEHLVFDKGMWKRIKEIDNITMKMKYVDKLYCLITDNNLLNINDNLFRDYSETDNIVTKTYINYYVLRDINRNITSNPINRVCLKESVYHTYINCFTKDIYDRITNNPKNENNIIGKVVLTNSVDIKLYDYCGYILSGNIIVYEEGRWIRIWMSKNATQMNSTKINYLYNIISNNNVLYIDDKIKIRDFTEIPDSEKISSLVMDDLN